MTAPRIPYVLREEDVQVEAIRAQGAGGQNVNKVSNAVHLRLDIEAAELPAELKLRLKRLPDRRVTPSGQVVIKAQRFRSLERNRQEAFERLRELLDRAARLPRPRRPTQPTAAARLRRVESKVRRGQIKAMRRRVSD
jgi:ribosome-associated protein